MIPRSVATFITCLAILFLLPAPQTMALLPAAQRQQGSSWCSSVLYSTVAGSSSSRNSSSSSGMERSSKSRRSSNKNVAAKSSSKNDMSVPWDWKAVARQAFEEDDRPIILFDGDCNLCNGGVNFAIDHDPTAKFRFVSLQSKIGQSLLLQNGKCPDDISSIVLCYKDVSYFKSDAILRISQKFPEFPFQLFGRVGLVVPEQVRDGVYKLVSENRYRFSKVMPKAIQDSYYNQCRLDVDGEYHDRFLEDPS